MNVYKHLQQRILTHYSAIRSIQKGNLPLPRTAIIYPTYGCNLDCLGCEYVTPNSHGFQKLPLDRLQTLMHELVELGVEGIEFCGGGEPSLYAGLGELVREFDPALVRFGLLTNGVTFTPALWEVFGSHFDYVRVSVDAGSEATYAKTRPAKSGNPWQQVQQNIGQLAELRNSTPDCRLKVSYKTLVSTENSHEMELSIQNAITLGCDSVQFKALRQSPAELSIEQTKVAERTLTKLKKNYPNINIVGSLEKLKMQQQCILTPLQTTIDPFGNIQLCCYYLHRQPKHIIGNILDTSFAEIWGSEKHRTAIEGIVPKQCNNLDCRFVRYHEVLDSALGATGGQFEFI